MKSAEDWLEKNETAGRLRVLRVLHGSDGWDRQGRHTISQPVSESLSGTARGQPE